MSYQVSDLIDAPSAATLAGMTRAGLHALSKRGRLTAVRISSVCTLYPKDQIARLVIAREAKTRVLADKLRRSVTELEQRA